MTEAHPMTSIDKLEPCPFNCGHSLVPAPSASFMGTAKELGTKRDMWEHRVRCCCGASGPVKDTQAEAITAWNTRSLTPQAGEGVERAKPLLDCTAKANHPIGRGERLVGFKLPEDVAGLSDGLFMLDALVALARRGAALPPAGRVEELEKLIREALPHLEAELRAVEALDREVLGKPGVNAALNTTIRKLRTALNGSGQS